MLCPCCVTKGLDCVFPIWFTQCSCVWFTHAMTCPCWAPAMLRPYSTESDFSRPWHSMVGAWHGTCDLTSVVKRWPVSDLPTFGFSLLLRRQTFTKVVNQTAAAFWDVFNCSDDNGDMLYRIWNNLTVKASLSSVVMLHFHWVFFSLGQTSPLFSNYT